MQQRVNPRILSQKLRAYSPRVPRIDEAAQMPLRATRAAGRTA
jgi:hypothetical protein